LKARKVLVIADSCFAGSLLAHEGFTPDATRKSRELLAAGGLHPIADAGSSDGERSVFISCLCKGLTALADAGRPFITKDLFAEVYGPLKAKSAQEPQNGILRDTFHEGGQFLFYPVRKASGEGTVEKPPSPERGVTAKGLSLDLGGGVTMNLALIPAGQFTAGGEGSNPDCVRGNTKHRVRITKPFYIGVTEVTQEQYEAVIGKNPSNVHGAKNPVECVSWSDAQEFCKKLNARLAASSQHSALRAQHLSARLPTEAEWEYACRAGSTGAYCFGDSGAQLADYAWYKDNAGDDTHPVGEKKPNAWGLYDMHGNVWEMCQDWHGHYPSGTVDDPIGPTTGYSRVIRGGAWSQSPMQARSAFRDWVCNPTGPSVYAGFRVVVVAK
jgi:formylglycine-generating enzyme required for sulfatase activity